MTSQESQPDESVLFMDDECRLTRIEGVPTEAHEWLADLFIVLRSGFAKDGCGALVVRAELDRFIELMFQRSEAYRLVLTLYAGRYEVIAGKPAEEILREAIEKYMPERALLIDDDADEQASE